MEPSVVLPELPTYLFAPTLAGVVSFVLTVFLPVAAALFMRTSWTGFARGLVLLAFSAAKAFLEAWLAAADAGTSFNPAEAGYAVVVNFGIAVAFYFGLLRGSDLQQAALLSGPVRDPRPAPLE